MSLEVRFVSTTLENRGAKKVSSVPLQDFYKDFIKPVYQISNIF